MHAYDQNLRAMVNMAREAGVGVAVGTVPSNHVAPLLLKEDRARMTALSALYSQGRWQEGRDEAARLLRESAARHQSSDLETGIVRRLAEQLAVPLLDAEAAIAEAEPHGVPGETMFMDHCHLSRPGLDVWAGVVVQTLAQVLTEPGVRSAPAP